LNGGGREEIGRLRDEFFRSSADWAPPSCDGLPGFEGETALDLYVSRTTERSLHGDEHVDRWVDAAREACRLRSRIVSLRGLAGWEIDRDDGNIFHASGRFFTITGLKVLHRTRYGQTEWDQPVIDQPEIGILGMLAKKFHGVLHFCLQAKEEPGNIGGAQLSPTVQATFSNYSRAHGGKLPPFIEMFLDPPRERVLFAKLQTEDGGRFLFKSNRNMVVLLPEEEAIELPDNFIWLTLRQVGRLMRRDNLINACARSVISCLI
jgi:oxidase EvaA